MVISDAYSEIATLGRRQGGHVTHAQLRLAGLSVTTITRHTRGGRLIRVHRGVYAVGHLPTNALDRARGALLAAGPRSALAGASAAALWGLFRRHPARPELVSPLRHRIPGVTSRIGAGLLWRDIRSVDGVRVTSPARTLLDLAPRITERDLHRYHNELRMRRLITNDELTDVALRNPNHPGARRVRALAGESGGEPKRSQLELDWRRFGRRHLLPPHEMNVFVGGYRVDVFFRQPRPLVVELDGWGTHGTRRAYEDDRERDARILERTGIPTVRITHDALHQRGAEQARRLRRILG